MTKTILTFTGLILLTTGAFADTKSAVCLGYIHNNGYSSSYQYKCDQTVPELKPPGLNAFRSNAAVREDTLKKAASLGLVSKARIGYLDLIVGENLKQVLATDELCIATKSQLKNGTVRVDDFKCTDSVVLTVKPADLQEFRVDIVASTNALTKVTSIEVGYRQYDLYIRVK